MSPFHTLRTGRLVLTPVGGGDLADLRAIKADPRVFAIMMGGVRNAAETAEDLAHDVIAWGALGYGIWAVREAANQRFVGITGLQARTDNRGDRVALRSMAGGPGSWPRPRGGGRGVALRSRSGRFEADRRGGARDEFRVSHGARVDRHGAMRGIHAKWVRDDFVRKR